VGRLHEEAAAFLRAGIDGLFTDHPDVGVRACLAAN
jgi:glycerophosphoryl diester phosphodiesterase